MFLKIHCISISDIESDNSPLPCRSPSPQRRSRTSPEKVEFIKTRSRTNALRLFHATANSILTPDNQVIAPAPQLNQRFNKTSQVSPREPFVIETNRDDPLLLDHTPGPSFQTTNVPQIPSFVPHLAATGPRISEYVTQVPISFSPSSELVSRAPVAVSRAPAFMSQIPTRVLRVPTSAQQFPAPYSQVPTSAPQYFVPLPQPHIGQSQGLGSFQQCAFPNKQNPVSPLLFTAPENHFLAAPSFASQMQNQSLTDWRLLIRALRTPEVPLPTFTGFDHEDPNAFLNECEEFFKQAAIDPSQWTRMINKSL